MKQFILTVCLVTAGAACAEPAPKYDVVIQGPITRGSMAPVLNYALGHLLNNDAPGTVSIVLNSPGGEVDVGTKFIAVMKSLQAKGTKFVCYVPGMAASMAFGILTACNERHALVNSGLLWHRARVGIMMATMTGPELFNIGGELLDTDLNIYRDLEATLGKDMQDKDIRFHFENQTMHTGLGLHRKAPNFITAHDSIPGLIESLSSKDGVHTAVEDKGRIRIGAIMYIWEQAVNWTTGIYN